jgi:hypothetical protein
MLPSDTRFLEACFLKKEQNCKDNNRIPFWKRKQYKVKDGLKEEFKFYLEFRELIKLYAAVGNGKRVTKKVGKEKYNLLSSIRKRKETIKAKKDGTFVGSSRNTRKIYTSSDFPIAGAEYGGIDLIKDTHRLTDQQWNCGWISDEEGKMTIMDVGQYMLGVDGKMYDFNGNVKPSRAKLLYEMDDAEKAEYIKMKEDGRKVKRKVRNRNYYLKKKMEKSIIN